MPTQPSAAAPLADVRALAQAIRAATEAEVEDMARALLATDDAHLFGQNEFRLRDLAHRIAAKAFEQHLARKKTATTAPA